MLTGRACRFIETGEATIPASMRPGMLELVVAHEYAQDVRTDPWQFAVEVTHLTAMGLTAEDIRWLVARRYIAVAREVSRFDDPERKFQPIQSVRFGKRACFIVTAAGLRLTTADPERSASHLAPLRKAA